MGLLAGPTGMLLTIIWGTCVVVGKCDIENSVTIDGKDTKGCSLTGSGVSTDIYEFDFRKTFSSLDCTYCLCLNADFILSLSGILRHLRMRALGRLLRDDGTPNKEIIEKQVFGPFHCRVRTVDGNGDGYISTAELKALIIGIRFDEIDLDEDDAVEKVMKDFDTSLDHQIDLQEFICGIEKWLEEARRSGPPSLEAGAGGIKYLDDFHRYNTKREHDLLGDASDEVIEGVGNPKWTTIKAVLLLLLGTLIAAAFANPLVDAVDNFSDATSIPTFFISFIALPFANSSEAVSAIIFATWKRQRSTSLTFSELYGAVTMNNVLCLSVVLALVYIRGLTWDFSAEVLVIVIVSVVMGAFASFRTTFPPWTAILAFLLYPFSLALVYVLDCVLGWS
ncbi:sodium/calcium exchanger family protein / calcium-binding EF hand family protein [Actinidia rufa]|uniref:Sodium/calcium exchanger family protein / calcium-binding EF hand family protein n=1 Tax=Actinidia rufa TaxID=165716 RepID=A0A7J0G3U9_9ERIC|nr:sodium/calcium exchanger family protein / calcium-binding EF hand family protein [Actinidia rufa]